MLQTVSFQTPLFSLVPPRFNQCCKAFIVRSDSRLSLTRCPGAFRITVRITRATPCHRRCSSAQIPRHLKESWHSRLLAPVGLRADGTPCPPALCCARSPHIRPRFLPPHHARSDPHNSPKSSLATPR